jgi:hypothetical protein
MKGTPKPNRLIFCRGSDWSDFTCYGMWVPYKSPPNKPGSGRFMIRREDGSFQPDKETWKSVDYWEYVDDESPAPQAGREGECTSTKTSGA